MKSASSARGRRVPATGTSAPAVPAGAAAVAALDSWDRRILAELQADARLPMAELGRRVHLSQPATAERVRKLEAAGVITGYRAIVSPQALGYGIRAIVRAGRADYARMLRLLGSLPEVLRAYNVTGEDSWVLEIAVRDVAHLDEVVSQVCLLAETSTSIILKAPLDHQPLLPAAAPTGPVVASLAAAATGHPVAASTAVAAAPARRAGPTPRASVRPPVPPAEPLS